MESSVEHVKPEHFEHIYALIDESGDGRIELDEFVKIFEVFELYKYESGKASILDNNNTNVTSELQKETIKEKMRRAIESIQYEFIVNIVTIFNILALTIKESVDTDDTELIIVWVYV
jgi:hypothetical protein